jgi:hypothetical protein
MSQTAPPVDAMPFSRRLEWSLAPVGGQEQGNEVPPREPEPGNVPRVARLMALAIHFDGFLRRGEAPDYTTLARLGQVTRARMSQIMGLLHLAPDIQEALLFFPRTLRGRDPITEHDLRPIAAVADWEHQREAWGRLLERCSLPIHEEPGRARHAVANASRGVPPPEIALEIPSVLW